MRLYFDKCNLFIILGKYESRFLVGGNKLEYYSVRRYLIVVDSKLDVRYNVKVEKK